MTSDEPSRLQLWADLQDARAALAAVKAERDELAAALRAFIATTNDALLYYKVPDTFFDDAFDKARTALAALDAKAEA